MKRLLWCCAGLAFLSGGLNLARASYIFSSIDVPGAASTVTSGINNVGQIVGFYSNTSGIAQDSGTEQGFLLSGGTFNPINFPGATATEAAGLNDVSQIVGVLNPYLSGESGFLLSGGVFSNISAPGITGGAWVFGINDVGQILGDGWLLSGGAYSTIQVPGSIDTFPRGINNAGEIVGGFDDATGGHGFLRSSDGSFTTLDVPGGFGTEALGLNDNGEIVGQYHLNGNAFGFVYSGGAFTTLHIPGSTATVVPFSVNNSGQLVGLRDGPLYPGDTEEHGFLATPAPEPTTLALMGIGITVLSWFRIRRPPVVKSLNGTVNDSNWKRV